MEAAAADYKQEVRPTRKTGPLRDPGTEAERKSKTDLRRAFVKAMVGRLMSVFA